MPEPTIYDVARLAGVSLATVSRVLNQYPHVRPKTREQVVAAMRSLNYQPNLMATALMTGHTRTVGLLVSDISNPFFGEICRGVEDAAAGKGLSVIICNTDEREEREAQQTALLRQKGVDGVIFASAYVGDHNLAQLQEHGIPIVLVSRGVEGPAVDTIGVDDFTGGYQAARHLLSLGHRLIAHLTGPLNTRPGLHRKKGFEAALEEAGVAVNPDWVLPGSFSLESGLIRTLELLAVPGERPTAIVAGNDLIAIGAMRVLRQRGLRVPEDVSIVGYDRTTLAEIVDPELTSVAQPMQEMGRRALEMLLEVVTGRRSEPLQVVLPPRLVLGHSTGPVPQP